MSAPTPEHVVRRQMRDQSMQIPWREFATACDELLCWRSFSHWVAAVAKAEAAIPAWLAVEIEKQCPGFLGTRPSPTAYTNLHDELNQWVDHHMFPNANEGGWSEALRYYVDRSPERERLRLVPAWANRQSAYPPFAEWRREVMAAEVPRLTSAVPQFIEWEAFAFWVRLLVDVAGSASAAVKTELDSRCPGFLASLDGKVPTRPSYSMWCWEQLVFWIEQHQFGDAARESWLQTLRNAARRHVRCERIVAYWAECDRRWHRKKPARWPSFEEWLASADAYVEGRA